MVVPTNTSVKDRPLATAAVPLDIAVLRTPTVSIFFALSIHLDIETNEIQALLVARLGLALAPGPLSRPAVRSLPRCAPQRYIAWP